MTASGRLLPFTKACNGPKAAPRSHLIQGWLLDEKLSLLAYFRV
jgi:hypothetical protein